MSLTAKERARLKALAHSLKPVHHIGKEGVTEAGLTAIRDAFTHRELIKVKVRETSPQSAAEAGALVSAGLEGVEHVQTIGRTIVLFRPLPKDE
jgi:RNA-binding protein